MASKEEIIACIEQHYNPRHKHDGCYKISRYSALRKELMNLFCSCFATAADLSLLKMWFQGVRKTNTGASLDEFVQKLDREITKNIILDLLNEDCWTKKDFLDVIKIFVEKNKGTCSRL